MRIGHGFDVHSFTEGRPLILGGVNIPYEKGLAAHSDGDVVIHALCDALLGAAALGDIGQHFPDNDVEFKNIDSRILLRRVVELLKYKGWKVSNADITVIAEAPKMAPHIVKMREILASDLDTAIENLNIKATTTEKMGFTGRGEGVAVHAVALLLAHE
ncbi:MAG: 2-C-methyl-D-erythritol 2,4-cyclodiphosphate synthase [Gammaproteobacteria bacterium]|jgi:2-C-methyl-D-erythritol 2,4-cyclodiphosphate synthase|nr:2-C-methyl-D-erythritol 2,4-cyclodiphosphate synthase [Gammaproteobacteria bacterium]